MKVNPRRKILVKYDAYPAVHQMNQAFKTPSGASRSQAVFINDTRAPALMALRWNHQLRDGWTPQTEASGR